MDIYAIKDLRWKMIKYSFDKHKRLRTVSVLWGVQFNAGVTRSLKRSIYCIFKLFSIQSRMFLSCGMKLGKKIDWNFRGFCSKCWNGCCIKFNAARLHWEVRQQRPWFVSNNWKHGLWQHLMRHYLWWPTMNHDHDLCYGWKKWKILISLNIFITIGQLGITQQVNWEMQQISATARSGPVS